VRLVVRAEEEHARLTLSGEFGVEFRLYDDGSKPGMPDLLSADDKHVAEVITTAPSDVRKEEQHLDPVAEPRLPHCVWVMIPYTRLGGATKDVGNKIKVDIIRWTVAAGCEYHWSEPDEQGWLQGIGPDPILSLGGYDDGVRALCVQQCQHSDDQPHEIRWSVGHEASTDDPWTLIRRSLHIIEKEQRGGVQSLAKKLDGYPNKHLVMYPFGPPGNVTAAFSSFVPPPNLRDLLLPQLNPPLADIHIWLLYRYGNGDVVEGLHLCSGHWAKFGTTFPKLDLSSPLGRFHYRDT